MSAKKSGNANNMKTFGESEKSRKTLESMTIKPDTPSTNSNNNNVAKKKGSKAAASVTFSPKVRETIPLNENGSISDEGSENGVLNEDTRLANLAKLTGKKG
jgi:hypothetical protein